VLAALVVPGEGTPPAPVEVLNLSPRGIGLRAGRAFAPESLAELRLLNRSATFSLIVTVRIVRCESLLVGDHLLGCEMTRVLEPSELQPFLA
jgi:hypothetical protein